MEIILIGPGCAGKSTLGRLLAESLGLKRVPLDRYKYDYFKEIGYDEKLAEEIMKTDGFNRLYEYWRLFEAHSVVRVLEDYKDCVIDFGAGHTIYDDEELFDKVKSAMAPYPNVILLLPSKDRELSLKILNEREGYGEKSGHMNFAKLFLNVNCNYELAKYIVYTEGDTPGETRDRIINLLGLNDMKTSSRISGSTVYLEKSGYRQWAAAREKRYEPGFEKYDPLMPVLSEAGEREFYIGQIDSDKMEVFGIIKNDGGVVGYINAFGQELPYDKAPYFFEDALESTSNGGSCETGITIYGQENRGKGYGHEAYTLFLQHLKEKYRLQKTVISAYSKNLPALRLYDKLGYKKTGSYTDAGYEYIKMEYLFE